MFFHSDGNGTINFKEFQVIMDDLGIYLPAPEALEFFKELDTGMYICLTTCLDELEAGTEWIKDILLIFFYIDKSGSLSFEEYIELVFELRFPLISTLHKMVIAQTGVSDECMYVCMQLKIFFKAQW